jgi:hypothetical protein
MVGILNQIKNFSISKNRILFLLIISFHLFTQINTWTVTCDNSGSCTVYIENQNLTVQIGPGYLPLYPEKNIIPLKNSTNSIAPVIKVNPSNFGLFSEGYLKGSKQFECSDGINECANSCCSKGLCTDPSNKCEMARNTANLIILIVGLFFLAVIIAYWVTFYILGVRYNASPMVKRSENIYFKHLPNSSSSTTNKATFDASGGKPQENNPAMDAKESDENYNNAYNNVYNPPNNQEAQANNYYSNDKIIEPDNQVFSSNPSTGRHLIQQGEQNVEPGFNLDQHVQNQYQAVEFNNQINNNELDASEKGKKKDKREFLKKDKKDKKTIFKRGETNNEDNQGDEFEEKVLTHPNKEDHIFDQ